MVKYGFDGFCLSHPNIGLSNISFPSDQSTELAEGRHWTGQFEYCFDAGFVFQGLSGHYGNLYKVSEDVRRNVYSFLGFCL